MSAAFLSTQNAERLFRSRGGTRTHIGSLLKSENKMAEHTGVLILDISAQLAWARRTWL